MQACVSILCAAQEDLAASSWDAQERRRTSPVEQRIVSWMDWMITSLMDWRRTFPMDWRRTSPTDCHSKALAEVYTKDYKDKYQWVTNICIMNCNQEELAPSQHRLLVNLMGKHASKGWLKCIVYLLPTAKISIQSRREQTLASKLTTSHALEEGSWFGGKLSWKERLNINKNQVTLSSRNGRAVSHGSDFIILLLREQFEAYLLFYTLMCSHYRKISATAERSLNI